MCDTKLTNEGCFGPHLEAHTQNNSYGILGLDETQRIVFPSLEECTSNDGPWWLSEEARAAKKLDVVHPAELEVDLSIKELRQLLWREVC
jgi:hypothetical protein